MNKLIHFLRYDNTVPIVLGVIFLGATGTYAATNPEVVYSTEQHVLSVDNTYLANKDLSSWSPRAEIVGVTEDAENYYVAYRFSTIDNVEYVWRDTVKEEVMTVSKADLGQYRDLGVYVTQQLKQKIDRELARLTETQEIEKKQISQKMVATAYGGIVGKFLDDTMETLPGYEPVVVAPTEPVAIFTEALPPPPEIEPEPEVIPEPVETEIPDDTATSTPDEPDDNEPVAPDTGLAIQILGDNPARVAVGGTYTDLGAVATNDTNEELTVKIFVNGAAVESVSISTATTSTYTIRYIAEDSGSTKEATRTVEVFAATPESPAPTPEPTPEPAASSTPPAPEPEPAPTTPPTEAPAETPTEELATPTEETSPTEAPVETPTE
jgi:hypothetical protein